MLSAEFWLDNDKRYMYLTKDRYAAAGEVLYLNIYPFYARDLNVHQVRQLMRMQMGIDTDAACLNPPVGIVCLFSFPLSPPSSSILTQLLIKWLERSHHPSLPVY